MTNILVTEEERTHSEEQLKSLLRAVELDVELEVEVDGNKLYFNVFGPDARYFLRNKEEILKGASFLLQTLHDKVFPDKDIEIRFDANRTLIQKETEMKGIAETAAAKLMGPGDEIILDPLNPYERRLVHIALKEKPNLQTESIGEGHYKRIKVCYVANADEPVSDDFD